MVKKNIRPTAGRGGMQPTYTTASIHAKPRSKNSKTNTCTTFERNPATARRRNRPPPGLHGRRDGAARETAEPKAQTERVRERARQDGVRDDRRPHRRVHQGRQWVGFFLLFFLLYKRLARTGQDTHPTRIESETVISSG